MDTRRIVSNLSMYLIVGVVLLPVIGCSKKEAEAEPEVTVQAVKAERQSIRQVIRSEAVLYPSGHHAKNRCPSENVLRESWKQSAGWTAARSIGEPRSGRCRGRH